jgi:hypothetical protein
MKKFNVLLTCCIWLVMLWAPPLRAQYECTPLLYVSLAPDGTYTMFPEDLLVEGDLNGVTTQLSQSAFTCDDLGPNNVTLSIYENEDLIFECTSNVIIEDKVNPVANCVSSTTVELDASGQHIITFAEIDNGSFDACGTLSYTIQPLILDCDSDNPTLVTLGLTDGSGNTSSCTVAVNWEPYPDPNPNIACNALITVVLGLGQSQEITTDMVLEGGPYGCPFQYEMAVLENNIPRPEPVVTLADTNATSLIFQIQDLNTGNICWGEIDVNALTGCDPVFTICDTECHSAPLGDCNSGHSSEDHIEWPCDINITGDCSLENLTFSPAYLAANDLAAPEDIMPVIIDSACYTTATFYTDQVFIQTGFVDIQRTWAVIDWTTGSITEYVQHLFIDLETYSICDTQPWNTPIGDCPSGHTDTDGVEWPADITVESIFIHPEDLALNPDVDPMDVEPSVYTECTEIFVTYTDQVFVINDSTLSVERTWNVFDFLTELSWIYVQTITVHADANASMVCVTREAGDPIVGVELTPGVFNDETGCHSFENPEGIIVTPVKDSPLQEGVNLLDKILLMEHLLGIRVLSPYQIYAADLSQDGALSVIDVVLIDQLIAGTLLPNFDHNWKFFNRSNQLPFADISNPLQPYKFIGVKMGDIDNSYIPNAPLPLQEIDLTVTDEILNKKEEYNIPFYLGQNERVSGYTVRISSQNIPIDFQSVTAPSLPGFSMENNVTITPEEITINWIAPQDYLEFGVAIPMTTPLFTLQLKPQENGILSESLTLSSTHDNLLKPSDEDGALAFAFEWENVIISSVLNPGVAKALSFYPNPVKNEIRFNGFDAGAEGTVTIFDASGRIYQSDALTPSMQIENISEGMYYLKVDLKNGERYVAPMIKINP